MKTTFTKEIPFIAVALLPTIYLIILWNSLPDIVPIHWGLNGNIDGYGSVYFILFLPTLPFLIYGLLNLIPRLDKKNATQRMGGKYQHVKLALTLFMSLIALYIIHVTNMNQNIESYIITASVGALFLFLGNYFQTIKPNKWLGIRTPWTLKNEEVWRATHRTGGHLWFIAGLIIVISSFSLSEEHNIMVFLALVLPATITPIIHSYILYKKVNNSSYQK